MPLRLGSEKGVRVTSADAEALRVRASALPGTGPRKRPGLAFVCSADENFSEDGK